MAVQIVPGSGPERPVVVNAMSAALSNVSVLPPPRSVPAEAGGPTERQAVSGPAGSICGHMAAESEATLSLSRRTPPAWR